MRFYALGFFITLGSFQIFQKNLRRYSQVKGAINDTGGKFATGVNYNGGNFPPVPTALATKFCPC